MPEMPALVSGLFINPAILWVILFFVDRHNVDRSMGNLFLVSVVISVLSGILSLCIPAAVAPVIFVIAAPIVSLLCLRRFCDIGWLRAIIPAILFTIWLIAWPHLGMFLLTKLAG